MTSRMSRHYIPRDVEHQALGLTFGESVQFQNGSLKVGFDKDFRRGARGARGETGRVDGEGGRAGETDVVVERRGRWM